MPSAKHIVFISHDLTRTGAPILLLNLAKVLLEHGGYTISFLIKEKRGDMYPQFVNLAPVSFAGKEKRVYKGKIAGAIARRLLKQEPFSEEQIAKALEHADIVVSNTITNGDLLPLVRKVFKGPLISYIHELKMAAGFFTSPEHIRSLLDCTDHFLICSLAVKAFMQTELRVDPAKMDLLHYYIPAKPSLQTINKEPDYDFVVGGAGTTDWRKGPEFFIAVAALVFSMQPDAEMAFIWKGAQENSLDLARLQYDIEKAGLNNKVNFIPASAEMDAFYKQVSLFLLTSREDPYPLVVLEAAAAGIPTICFREAGGAAEFVETDAGTAVKYTDITAMADRILFYYNNRMALQEAGAIARKKLVKRHQQPGVIAAQLEAVLSKLTTHEI